MNKANLLKKPSLSIGGGGGALLLKKRAPQPEPMADPLADVEYTDDIAEDAARELTALEAAFNPRKHEQQQRKLVIDTEFWNTICWQTRAEKEAFLAGFQEKFGINLEADKYLDGAIFAAALGIELPARVPLPASRGVDRKLAELAM